MLYQVMANENINGTLQKRVRIRHLLGRQRSGFFDGSRMALNGRASPPTDLEVRTVAVVIAWYEGCHLTPTHRVDTV
jgi:hypothetical protein